MGLQFLKRSSNRVTSAPTPQYIPPRDYPARLNPYAHALPPPAQRSPRPQTVSGPLPLPIPIPSASSQTHTRNQSYPNRNHNYSRPSLPNLQHQEPRERDPEIGLGLSLPSPSPYSAFPLPPSSIPGSGSTQKCTTIYRSYRNKKHKYNFSRPSLPALRDLSTSVDLETSINTIFNINASTTITPPSLCSSPSSSPPSSSHEEEDLSEQPSQPDPKYTTQSSEEKYAHIPFHLELKTLPPRKPRAKSFPESIAEPMIMEAMVSAAIKGPGDWDWDLGALWMGEEEGDGEPEMGAAIRGRGDWDWEVL